MPSPYELVLGPELDRMHPRLRAYFSVIPPGAEGDGEGVFDRAGWRWTALALLARLVERDGALVGARHRNVPFRVTNRPAGSAARPSVRGARTMQLGRRSWTMIDEIGTDGRTPPALVDVLGRGRRVRADFDARIVDGALVLTSRAIRIRLGRGWLRLPAALVPGVRLTERFDDARDEQHVDVTLALPLIGTVYGYEGFFRYRIHS